jgi:hypothetical protein
MSVAPDRRRSLKMNPGGFSNEGVATMPDMLSITDVESLIEKLGELPKDFHKAGTVSKNVLQTIFELCGTGINHSMETGSGKTTILFSHLSRDHRVFAVDGGTNSISAVRQSSLFNSRNVEFIEGPTQKTLPLYDFQHKLQVAYLDGPHAYPFPDLEYFYVYPNLEVGGFLILDDIHIPTINNLFRFLLEDDMFESSKLVETTAFFKRTDAPMFYPYSDGWNKQRYNSRRFPISPPYTFNNHPQGYLPDSSSIVTFDHGFHHSEGNFRWMSSEGSLTIPAPMLANSSVISFELTCGPDHCYSQFPFQVQVFLNGKPSDQLEFTSDLHKQLVQLQAPIAQADTNIRIVSNESFIPSEKTGGEDHRQLSVMLSKLTILPTVTDETIPLMAASDTLVTGSVNE